MSKGSTTGKSAAKKQGPPSKEERIKQLESILSDKDQKAAIKMANDKEQQNFIRYAYLKLPVTQQAAKGKLADRDERRIAAVLELADGKPITSMDQLRELFAQAKTKTVQPIGPRPAKK